MASAREHGDASWLALPRGPLDLARQTAIWISFVVTFQLVQAGAGGDRSAALAEGLRVVRAERWLTGTLVELRLQHAAASSRVLDDLTAWTYWLSELAVVGLALLWVYLRRNAVFKRVRNTVICANVLGLSGFYLFPTAPPRAFPQLGFADTLGQRGSLNHGHGLIPLPSNQYAAFPSLHAADALIVGVALALLVRPPLLKAVWLLWPAWVGFSVMATANHFWLDIAAGVVVAAAAAAAVNRLALVRLVRRRRAPRGSRAAGAGARGRRRPRPDRTAGRTRG